MLPQRSAAEFLPARKTLPSLRRAVQSCRGCELYARATQGVMGMTVHPSALLRIPDPAERHRAFDAFVRDLRSVRDAVDAREKDAVR